MIDRLTDADRPAWTQLWTDYLAFYQSSVTAGQYDHTWRRLMAGEALHGLALRHEGEVCGIAHFLFHESAWTMDPVCYLQDLFIVRTHRGLGGGRRLIEAVAAAAREAGATRLYWLTQAHNDEARRLYDRLAKHTGFIRYEYPL